MTRRPPIGSYALLREGEELRGVMIRSHPRTRPEAIAHDIRGRERPVHPSEVLAWSWSGLRLGEVAKRAKRVDADAPAS